MSDSQVNDAIEGIAIIGMSARFPKARDIAEFWRNLCDGVECVDFFSDEELRAEGVDESLLKNPRYVKAGSLLEDADCFDAPFFGYSPREAEIMDPQQRLFLEGAWGALEDAGYDPDVYEGAIGVFAGASFSHYSFGLYSNLELFSGMDSLQLILGNAESHLATRTSYKLNLKGPSVFVQSACSTSLVAVHLACQSLLNYQCNMALAGGVSVTTPKKSGYVHREGGVLSPDGHCRTFDAEAKGTIIGNGMGVVVLKRLSDAVADGDRVRAVVRGSAINNDGSEKVGYTAPSVRGQAEVIAEALALGGVEPGTVGYVEAHGTATELGDPIEVEALTQVFGAGGGRQFCAIGSVKSNFGHLLAAAGVAGLIKAVLAVEEGRIPPSLNFRSPNPKIDFASSPFFVCDRLSPWPAPGGLRRAGVSSFGIGGTNAHVVIEQAPAAPEPSPAGCHQLLTLSARTPSALEVATDSLADALERLGGGSPGAEAVPAEAVLADAAYTLGAGRRHFAHRRCVVASTAEEASRLLRSRDARRVRTRFSESKSPAVVFLFPGQGAQYVNMGRSLYEAGGRGGDSSGFGEFTSWLDRCCELLLPELGLDLRGVLYPEAGGEAEAAGLLRQTRLTQPALFAVEYALARQLMAWGVRPWAMVGHSVGEWVAACLAGVFTPEAALRLVAERGRLMQAQPAGGMLAVPLGEAELAELAAECGVWVAAVNAPGRCVAAGAEAGLALLEARLEGMGLGGRRLETSHAFHSGPMEGAVGSLVEAVRREGALGEPHLPFASNVTGRWVTAEEARDPRYWGRQMRSCVRFGAGLEEALAGGERVVVEVGPGRGLSGLARRAGAAAGTEPAAYAAMRGEGEEVEDEAVLLEAVGGAWLGGAGVEWGRVFGGGRRRVPLPTYPFERRRYWVEAGKGGVGAAGGAGAKGKGGAGRPEVADWFHLPSWKRGLAPEVSAGAVSGRWLVFGRGGGVLTAAVMGELGRLGGEAVLVESGAGAARTGAGYAVRAGEREDYEWLAGEALGGGGEGLGVIHLWGAEDAAGGVVEGGGGEVGGESAGGGDVAWGRAQEEGFYSLLALAQALGRANFTSPVRLAVVTSGVESVAGEAARRPEWATVTGPCKVIAQEYPNVRCEHVDVAWGADGVSAEGEGVAVEWARRVVAEASSCEESEVALRGRGRWVRHYEPVRLGGGDESWVRRGGVYLITGGTGGIGLALAGWLAREEGARLLLVSRGGMSVSGMTERVREMEEAGAEVLVAAADVRDEGAVRDAVREAVRRWGGIDGVIHAAGIAGGGMMQGKSRAAAGEVLGAKAEGLRVVERVVGEEGGGGGGGGAACSSLAAVRGGLGQSDYCGANAYLDAWARGEGGALGGARRVSINWGAWAEVGMAVDYESSLKGRRRGAGSAVHPLLDECVSETPDKVIYSTTFNQERHWTLSEHQVGGKSTLPGVAYLEIARAAVEKFAEGKDIELREVFFVTPLAVEDGGTVEAFTVLTRSGDDFEFSVVSKPAQDAPWQEHARGCVRLLERTAPRETDLRGIAESLTKEELLFPGGTGMTTSKVDDEGVPAFVYCGPRWNSLTRVNVGEKEALASLKLPDAFAADLGQFTLHPAILDMAVGFARRYAGAGAYLPFSYGRVTVKGPITAQVYSYLKFREELDPSKETITFDISVIDDRGREIVEIENFTVKRVSGERPFGLSAAAGTESRPAEAYATLEADLTTGRGDGAGALSKHVSSGIRTEEGLDAFRRIMARPELSQIAVSVEDLNELLKQKEIFTDARLLELEDLNKMQGVGATHERPELTTAYAAPRSELESKLAALWQEFLGIAKVGVHDNFFELGGDSILSIRVIARARQHGLSLTPDRLFRHPTVAELAASLAATDTLTTSARPRRSPLSGPAPLLPAQLRFFERLPAAAHHFNQAVLLVPRRRLDGRPLAEAARSLLRHHDALRAGFTAEGGVWRQVIAPAEASDDFAVEVIDLTGARSADEARAALEAKCERVQTGLSLGQGPLLSAALFELGEGAGQRLLLAAHHLVIDGVSWRVLLDDLERAYAQAEAGAAIELGEPTASVAERAEELAGWAVSGGGREEAEYWAAAERARAWVPVHDRRVENVEGAVVRARRRLGAEATRRLLAGVGGGRGAGVGEALAAALGVALCGWGGAEEVCVEVEGHGRESAAGLELSRTVGWLTAVYPVRLRGGGAGEALRWAKEELRGVPGGGVGYGALRYLGGEAGAGLMGERAVSFNYLGQFTEVGAGLWGWAEEGTGPWRGAEAARRYELEVEAHVLGGGEMEVACAYVGGRQDEGEMEGLVGRMAEAAEAMAGGAENVATPSDFPDAELSQRKLDSALAEMELD